MPMKSKPTRLTMTGMAAVCCVCIAAGYYWSPLLGQAALGGVCVFLLVCLQRSRKQSSLLRQKLYAHRKYEAMLKLQATHDSLTGLANRLLLTDRFGAAVERCKRNGSSFALIMLDLNGFKPINDRYGHDAGDQVLIMVAQRLIKSVRASDTVARLGGDEFVVLVEDFANPDELIHLGRKLVGAIGEPMQINGGTSLNVGASVGFSLYPHNGKSMAELLQIADKGMYECKTSGLMELQ